ncbi:MAG: hypothetical protein ACI9WU_000686 [Myxococcota bacterium]|jgi:hypothetical protein
MVMDFFKNLVRYRVEGVRTKANAKIYGATARAKGKASSKFNNAVDKPFKKAQEKAKNVGKKGQAKAKGAADKAKAKKDSAGKKKVKAPKVKAPKVKAPKVKAPKVAAPKAKKEEKVGLFGGKKNKGAPAPPPAEIEDYEMDPGMQTQAIDISSMVDDRAQDVVGWIVCLNGALRGRDFRLVTGRNVMGTAADCDVVLTDPYLSSKHMAIRHEEGRFTLIDLDSTNGTFLNDRRCSKEELIDNDKIRIGRTELKFKSLF